MSWLDYSDGSHEDENFDNMEEKIRHYQRIIRNPRGSKGEWPGIDIIETLVDYCLSSERYSDALEFCGIWLIYLPDSADAHHKRAVILSQLNQPEDALRSINTALEYNPLDYEVKLTKCIIYDQLGRTKDGLELIEEILGGDPGNEDALFRKAMLLESLFKNEPAIEILHYLENIEYMPEEVYQELAHCYHMTHNFERSIHYYEKALEINPFDHFIWYNYGVMLGHKGANYKSTDCYKMALALKEDFFPAWFNLGNAYAGAARLTEAIEAYEEMLKYCPDDVDGLHNLASTYADNRQYISAIEFYSKAIKIDESHYQSYFGRAFCYDALDKYKEALADYDRALKFTPNSKMILQAKGDLLYNMGNPVAALNIYTQALELDPHDEHSLYDVAFVYFELGDYDKSEFYLDKLLDVTYSYPDAWYMLAKIYIIGGNERKSVKCLIESIKLDETKFTDFLNEFPPLTSNFTKYKSQITKYLGR